MKRFLISCVALFLATSALAAERVSATRIGNNVYKLDNGRVAITMGCTALANRDDAILSDSEDTLTFIDDEEECSIRELR